MDGQKWFKFYGQDWLTDLKIMRLPIEDRLCYITLLCLASSSSEQGVIHDCDEEAVIQLTHLRDNPIDDDNEYTRARGCLSRFEELGMVTQIVTERYNRSVTDVTINSFKNRQNTLMTNAERQAKYREKIKEKDGKTEEKELKQEKSNEKVTRVTTKVTLDKSRVEKKRVDNITSDPKVSQDIVRFIDLWKDINPAYRKFFANKTERSASADLIKISPLSDWEIFLPLLQKMNADPFAKGKSTKPTELLRNIGYFKAWIDQKRTPDSKRKVAVIPND